MRKLSLAIAFGVCLVPQLVSTRAYADELSDLETSLNAQHDALTTSDCATACQALASIRRAADRICALEPGPRCVAAQAKVFEDTRKVRDACPQCAAATVTPDAPKPENQPAPQGESVEMSVRTSAKVEPGRGGCASCETGGASPSDLGAAAIGILALARLVRRRRKKN